MKRPLYKILASAFQAWLNCAKSENWEWFERHGERIEDLCKNYMPSGSGFDCGTRFDPTLSTPEKLVFITDYHHMDDAGYYDGWSENVRIIVTPSLSSDFSLRITGIRRKNRQRDLDYWHDTFGRALRQEVEI